MADLTLNNDDRTISGQFNKRFGIDNSSVVYDEKERRSAKERLGDYVDKKSTYIKRTGRYTNQVGRAYDKENRNAFREGGARIYKTGQEGKQLAKQIKNVKTSAKATPVSIAVASWTLFVWTWVLLPVSILTLGLFGMVYLSAETFFGGVINSAIDTTILFYWSWIFLIGCSFILHATAFAHYKLSGLKSLGGRGGSLKTSCFLLSFITSIIPGVAILPTILLWEVAVEVYPN